MPVVDFAPDGFSTYRPAPGIAPETVPMIIPLKFWTKYDKNPPEDWVTWVKKGEGGAGGTTSDAVKRVTNTPKWQIIGPAYEAWKKGEETPTEGTPLYAWNGVSREMADELKKFHIYTIEDLAQFPDHNLSKLPIQNLREWRKKAQAWIEAAGTSDIGAKLAERDKVIEGQQSQLEDMAEQFREMKAAMEALQKQGKAVATAAATLKSDDDDDMPEANPGESLVAADPPPKRGRPRKIGDG